MAHTPDLKQWNKHSALGVREVTEEHLKWN